jgi:hypothetical protein
MFGYNSNRKQFGWFLAVNTGKPVNSIAPVISGLTILGANLSCTEGTWTGDPNVFTYAYQWNRNGVAILGATNNIYQTTLADSLANITCTVTATNTAGSTSKVSNIITLGNYSTMVWGIVSPQNWGTLTTENWG